MSTHKLLFALFLVVAVSGGWYAVQSGKKHRSLVSPADPAATQVGAAATAE